MHYITKLAPFSSIHSAEHPHRSPGLPFPFHDGHVALSIRSLENGQLLYGLRQLYRILFLCLWHIRWPSGTQLICSSVVLIYMCKPNELTG